ncbi:hypothetical protein J6590_081881 [Homalodisca vitripennis]|nr:hypothetical protein J6590_081881 [Homalodisca vitripennis]
MKADDTLALRTNNCGHSAIRKSILPYTLPQLSISQVPTKLDFTGSLLNRNRRSRKHASPKLGAKHKKTTTCH